jgi:hypothetical protein
MALAMIWLWWAIARNHAPVPAIPTKNPENLAFELNYLEGLGQSRCGRLRERCAIISQLGAADIATRQSEHGFSFVW